MNNLDKIRRDLMKPKVIQEKRVPGEVRNQPCICGSGRKSKNCQCDRYRPHE